MSTGDQAEIVVLVNPRLPGETLRAFVGRHKDGTLSITTHTGHGSFDAHSLYASGQGMAKLIEVFRGRMDGIETLESRWTRTRVVRSGDNTRERDP